MNTPSHFFKLGILLPIAICFCMSACVSVNVGTGKTSKASDVDFTEPSASFRNVKVADTDEAWQSSTTGNSISYISECGPSSDLSLEAIQQDSLSGLNNRDILDSKEVDYNGRAALRTLASGKTDGIDVKVDLMIFKKNGCSYTLSYIGVANEFESERSVFNKFLEGFRAP